MGSHVLRSAAPTSAVARSFNSPTFRIALCRVCAAGAQPTEATASERHARSGGPVSCFPPDAAGPGGSARAGAERAAPGSRQRRAPATAGCRSCTAADGAGAPRAAGASRGVSAGRGAPPCVPGALAAQARGPRLLVMAPGRAAGGARLGGSGARAGGPPAAPECSPALVPLGPSSPRPAVWPDRRRGVAAARGGGLRPATPPQLA
mmetsp:Transcript_88106/g.278670  ORF Transcript_88106/g.278670 Transcript_88106/m.278670 type:complete len:206 (-) Transcript_88106:604-1221(-)